MKKRENFPPKQLGDFFRGGRILGDVCGGNLGGTFWGKCKKRGGKTFLGECWGSCEPQQILGARNFGGHF